MIIAAMGDVMRRANRHHPRLPGHSIRSLHRMSLLLCLPRRAPSPSVLDEGEAAFVLRRKIPNLACSSLGGYGIGRQKGAEPELAAVLVSNGLAKLESRDEAVALNLSSCEHES